MFEVFPSALRRASFLPLLLFLLPARSEPLRYASSPPASRDVAKSCTDAQLGAQELSRSPPPPEVVLLDRHPPLPALVPPEPLFLPVTDPILAEGMGLTPRVGDGLGEDRSDVDDLEARFPVLEFALARLLPGELTMRRIRGCIEVEPESWAAGRRPLVEVCCADFMGSDIAVGPRTRPGTSARSNGGCWKGSASDRGCNHRIDSVRGEIRGKLQ